MAKTSNILEALPAGRRLRTRAASRFLKLSFGEKTLILYFVAFYFFPMLVDFFVDVQIKYLLMGDLPFALPFVFAVMYLSVVIAVRRLLVLDIKIKAPFRKIMASKILTYLIFLLFVSASFLFSLSFSASFRHQQMYADAGLIPVVTFSVKMICHIFIFASLSNKPLVKLNSVHYVCYFAGLYFGFVSSYDILWAAVGLYSWLRNAKLDVWRSARKIFSKFGVVSIAIVVPAVVFGGMLNKLGLEGAIDFFYEGGVEISLDLIANRTFYHSYSLAVQLSDLKMAFSLSAEAWNIVVHQSYRRFLIILGTPVPSETLQTVSRLNFLVITGNNIDSGAGASPGLLGSVFYLPGSFMALPIHIVCVYNMIGMVDNILGKGKYSFPAFFGSLALFQALTDSFMDNFNPFSVGFIALLTMFYMSSYARTIADPADPKW